MDRNSEIYQLVKKINGLRNRVKIWNLPQVQRYADDIFYAFTRGNVFSAFTNVDYSFRRTVTYHPYPNGTVLCNINDNNDKTYVNNNQFDVSMGAGNFKIYEICGTFEIKKGIFKRIYHFFKHLIR
jgi:alpha-amylase